jgi:hypothetical protein
MLARRAELFQAAGYPAMSVAGCLLADAGRHRHLITSQAIRRRRHPAAQERQNNYRRPHGS